jgi:hypothetical protein
MVPLTGQERAWTSGDLVHTERRGAQECPAGLTLADLKAKGATQLGDVHLKALIVGKAFWVRNNVTGGQVSENFSSLGDTYYGARSNEFGYANYEMIPSLQYVLNPQTAMLNQFSIELGLTEQQKQRIVPILKAAGPQLQELKNRTSLKPLEKVEQLKQISGSIVDKINPILNPQQQQKSEIIREDGRRRLIETMSDQVMQRAEADVKREGPE